MKWNTILPISMCVLFGLIQCQAPESTQTTASSPAPGSAVSVDRGEYILMTSGCNDCHTPKKMTPQGPVPDMDQFLAGYPAGRPMPEIDASLVAPGQWVLFTQDLLAAVGPWGISYAANLTSHETGIGTWTYDNFKVAMTEGKHKGMENGRPILPPMPWQEMKRLTDDDLRSLFAYLKSVPPIDNVVPDPVPPTAL